MPVETQRVVRSLASAVEILGLNSGPVYWGCFVYVCVNSKVFCVNSWPYEDEEVTNKRSINLGGDWVPPFKI